MDELMYDSSSNDYVITNQTENNSNMKDNWDMAIGLQKVDNLKPSKYLENLVEENVNGNLTIKQVEEELIEYYTQKDNIQEINYNELECDFVSTRIVEFLKIDYFENKTYRNPINFRFWG